MLFHGSLSYSMIKRCRSLCQIQGHGPILFHTLSRQRIPSIRSSVQLMITISLSFGCNCYGFLVLPEELLTYNSAVAYGWVFPLTFISFLSSHLPPRNSVQSCRSHLGKGTPFKAILVAQPSDGPLAEIFLFFFLLSLSLSFSLSLSLLAVLPDD